MRLLFVHGWGFAPDFWTPLAALLPEWEHDFDDRGYFLPPRQPAGGPPPPSGEDVVAVAHSFGAMRVLADPPPGLAAIVAINGFARFTGDPGVPVRVVERMLRRFDADPRAVLAEFRRACGTPEPFPAPDPEPLRADLLRMRDEAAPPPTTPVTVLHGDADPILPPPMRAATFADHAARRLERTGGGHLLPLQDPAFCAAAIRAVLAERA